MGPGYHDVSICLPAAVTVTLIFFAGGRARHRLRFTLAFARAHREVRRFRG